MEQKMTLNTRTTHTQNSPTDFDRVQLINALFHTVVIFVNKNVFQFLVMNKADYTIWFEICYIIWFPYQLQYIVRSMQTYKQPWYIPWKSNCENKR